MEIRLEVSITPTKKPLSVYPSLECAESFLKRLLETDEAKRLAQECQVELPIYSPTASKLHRGLGFAAQTGGNHLFCCWEQEAGKQAHLVQEFDDLTPAALASGNAAKDYGGKRVEDQAGIHLVYQNGHLVKTFWIETRRR